MTKRRVDYNENMNEGSKKNTPSVPPGVPTNMKSSKIIGADDFLRDELLPSIPNDLALQVIAPKLSARGINILLSVGPTWREAVHRRWVYDARVRSHSTETFVVVTFVDHDNFDVQDWTYNLRLYSLHDNFACDLPPIPQPGFRYGYKCITLDGKLYMLGGGNLREVGPTYDASPEMFMIDLAGQKQWKQCASMQQPRHDFGAGVFDGKIYVFGGMTGNEIVCKSEVYDPKIDAWSSLADMILCRMGHQVAAVGTELFVYGGKGCSLGIPVFSQNLVAYNPVKNEWRQIVHSNTGNGVYPLFSVFVAQGKFHTMTEDGIDVYDIGTNSWRGLHSFSGLQDNSGEYLSSILKRTKCGWYVLPVGDEILIVYQSKRWRYRASMQGSIRAIQTRGFGSKNREVAGQEIANFLSSDLLDRDFDMCLIQL